MTQADKLATLNKRLDELDEQIKELENRRYALSLDSDQGSKPALREIAQIDEQFDKLYRERSTLINGLDQLKQLAEDEQKSILAKVDEQRFVDAANHAATVISLNNRIDAALADLFLLFNTRAEALNSIRNLHVVDSLYLNRFGKDATNAAVAAAGLQRYIDMRTPSPSGVRHLAANNKFLSGIGKPKTTEDAA